MSYPNQFADYERKALEALNKGKVAEAQVWATLKHAEVLSVISDRLESLSMRLT
ncbi:hypothetical protein ACIBCT_21010 [Streptosporangium sp. NPDC050855]|jgi:hypothetical protein|uniref:hypothetical protein n=1 Tax=Streptosporangium sp. NPDC050855 TaxID=3366194 RepID=UPI0037BE090B